MDRFRLHVVLGRYLDRWSRLPPGHREVLGDRHPDEVDGEQEAVHHAEEVKCHAVIVLNENRKAQHKHRAGDERSDDQSLAEPLMGVSLNRL